MTAILDAALELLITHWGHKSLRSSQAKVIQYASEGYDVIAVLPTSAGKSSMFQIPGLLFEGSVLVVSPLIALMKDQVDDCNKRKIPASYVNSHVTEKEANTRLAAWAAGEYKVFYIAPERMNNAAFREILPLVDISFVVLDEAHAHRGESRVLQCIRYPNGTFSIPVWTPVHRLHAGDWLVGWGHGTQSVAMHEVVTITQRRGSQDELVDIQTSAGTLYVTSDHPIYVNGIGYVPASSVEPGDDVRNLRSTVEAEQADSFAASEIRDEPCLFSQVLPGVAASCDEMPELLKSLAAEFPRDLLLKSVWACSAGRWFVAAHDRGQSNAIVCDTAESLRNNEVEGRPICEWKSWGKRSSAAPGPRHGLRLVANVHAGTTCMRWEDAGRATPLRESGLGECVPQVGSGSGREVTPNAFRTGQGSYENIPLRGSRLVRVTRVKRGRAAKSAAYDTSAGAVYTLEVTGSHTYFADGVLCHNCASVWGHAFRPEYLRICNITESMDPRPPVMAFTATATSDVVEDIARAVGLREDHKRVIADPVRPNLNYQVFHGSALANLKKLVNAWDIKKGRYIVYVGTQKMTEEIAGLVKSVVGKGVGFYHGGMNQADCVMMQDAFKDGICPVMVATNAFGMGIDVPDIRYVVHYGAPASLENYTQEVGRAGRDGLHSDCILLPDQYSVRLYQNFIDWGNPPYEAYQTLWDWLNENLEPNELLQMGDKSIGEMTELGYNAVNSAMSTMVAHGLIERLPIPFGTIAMTDVTTLRKIVVGTIPAAQSVRAVAKACWDLWVKPTGQMGGTLAIEMDRKAAAETAGLSVTTVGKALKWIESKGGWKIAPVDYRNTTQLLMPGVALSDVLPYSVISDKLEREQERLDRMQEYTNLPHGSHVPFIRAYFLPDEEGGEES